MLARVNTIKKAQDFDAIFKGAKSFRSDFFSLKTIKNKSGANRFAFMVSQKVSKKAVLRNKVRRRLAESVQGETKRIKKGTDLLIIALPGIEKKEFIEIKTTLVEALKRAGLIAND